MTQWLSRSRAMLVLVVVLATGCDRFASVETRMTRASANLEAGDYQVALIDVRKVLDDQPDNLDAQLLLVDVLAASGETQTARIQLERAIASGAAPAATERRKVELLLSLGDVEAAKGSLATSTTLTPGQREVFEGRLALQEQRPADAETHFDRALAADPLLIDAALGRIEAISAQGKTSEALQEVNVLLVREPESGRAWLYKGSLAAQAGDFASAIDALTKAIERGRGLSQTRLVQAHAQRIECYLATRQQDSAQSALTGLQAAAGESAIVSLMRAKVALAAGDASTAVNELRRFTQALPQNLVGRLLLAEALLEQGSTEQAFAEAVRNVAEFGDHDEPRLALAGIELRLGRVANVEETLQPLVARSPPNPMAIAMLAELRIRRGESVAGVSLLERSLAERPDSPQLRLQLAAAYLSTGEAKRALQTLDTINDADLAAARDRLRVIATAAVQDSATAQKELEAAIARHPQDVDLLLMAAAYQASTDHLDRARSYLQKAQAVRPDDPTLTLTLGRLELAAGRADEAERLTRIVLDKTPNDAGAMTLMAGIAAQRGQDAEVDAWLNRARIAKPDALDVRLALARRAFARGNAAEARDILAEAVRNSPSDPAARLALAELNASTGRYTEALGDLREAGKLQPNSPFILLATAKVQLAADQAVAARQSLKRALELVPGWLPAATTLAALETTAGNLPAALEIVREVRRIEPNGAASFALEGDVYLAAQRPADAATAFSTAYRHTPGAALATRAAQAKRAAKMSNPESELVDWLARTPDDALARRTLAEYHLSAGRNDAAIRELAKVVEARPQDALALNNLAWLYQQSNDPRALPTAEQAFASAPKVAAIADTYGWILVKSNSVDKGLEILQQAAELAPDNGQIQYHLAYALAEAGQRERAIGILRKATSSRTSSFESRSDADKLLATLDDK